MVVEWLGDEINVTYFSFKFIDCFTLLSYVHYILYTVDLWHMRAAVAILGKGLSEAAFTTIFLYTTELYPTVVRSVTVIPMHKAATLKQYLLLHGTESSVKDCDCEVIMFHLSHQTKWRGLHELHESSGSICGSAHPAAGGRVDSSSSDHHLLCGHHLRPGGSAASRDTQRQAARDDWWHWKATVGQFNTWKPQCVKFEVTVEPSGGSVERHRHKWMLIFKLKTDRPDRTTFLGMHGTIKRTCCSFIDRNCNINHDQWEGFCLHVGVFTKHVFLHLHNKICWTRNVWMLQNMQLLSYCNFKN